MRIIFAIVYCVSHSNFEFLFQYVIGILIRTLPFFYSWLCVYISVIACWRCQLFSRTDPRPRYHVRKKTKWSGFQWLSLYSGSNLLPKYLLTSLHKYLITTSKYLCSWNSKSMGMHLAHNIRILKIESKKKNFAS